MAVIDRSELQSIILLITYDTLQIKFEVHLNKEIVNCGAIQIFSTFKPIKKFYYCRSIQKRAAIGLGDKREIDGISSFIVKQFECIDLTAPT